MWEQNKISVVFPVFNEEEGVKACLEEYISLDIVDEIIAVDNNSTDNSANEIKKTNAKYVKENQQGYGAALQRGLKEATGDIIFMSESDNTFVAKDIYKFLMYADEFDVVFGTRTSKSLIWGRAKMYWYLRYGNVIVAKLLEYLFNGPCFTDVGCTLKMVRKRSLNIVLPQLKVKGSHFIPELMIVVLKNKIKCVEIPVNYKERVGYSKITSDFWRSFKLGLIIIGFCFKERFKR
jgi:glycosyltransferase involved in cell wall biosynthesis